MKVELTHKEIKIILCLLDGADNFMVQVETSNSLARELWNKFYELEEEEADNAAKR